MKKILVVVDMQNDFITGPLGTPEAVAIVDKVVEKIRGGEWDCVCATSDMHFDDYLNTQEGFKLPVKHCICGTNGFKINDRILLAAKDIPEKCDVVPLTKSSFGCVELVDWVGGVHNIDEEPGIELIPQSEVELTLVGVCTDICVISNALLLKAHYPEMKIVVDAACCAGSSPEKHRMALEVMKSCQVDVVNEKTVDDDLAYIQDMLDRSKC